MTSIQDDPWYAKVDHVRFKVLENFRGLPAGAQTVEVQLMPSFGMCSPIPYYPGKRYLVVPGRRGRKFYEALCFASRDVEYAADDIRQVRKYFAGKRPIHAQGRVATSDDSTMVDYLIRVGEAKPLAGVTVSTSRRGKTYSAITDADGRYILPLPAAGTYQVNAALPPYKSTSKEISVSRNGCAVQDFGLTVDNTISGQVLDERGQPLKNAEVGLIDLDRPHSSLNDHAWIQNAYAEKPDLNYEFEHVPLGRYLIVFNPDGPRRGGSFDLPFESTYYPSGSTRANAKIIEIKSGEIHLKDMDLTIGKRVEFRRVTIRAHFQNGRPMETALFRCDGLLRGEDDAPWMLTQTPLPGNVGSVQFWAPANRTLQLEVKDRFGRKLKRNYTAVYEPGSTPITKEFIVTP